MDHHRYGRYGNMLADFQLVWVFLVICDDQTHPFFGLDILAEECNKRSGSIQAVLVVFLEWIAPKRRREQLKF